MKKIISLSLLVCSSLFPAASPVARAFMQISKYPRGGLVFQQTAEQRRFGSGIIKANSCSDLPKENTTELGTFLSRLKQQMSGFDPDILGQLQYKSVSLEKITSEEWRELRCSLAAKALLFRRDSDDLVKAAEQRDHELTAHMLLCGFDPNIKPKNQYALSALETAVHHDDLLTLRALLDAGAYGYCFERDNGYCGDRSGGRNHILVSDALKLLIEYDAYDSPMLLPLMEAVADKKDLSPNDMAELVKKVVLLVQGGEYPNPPISHCNHLLDGRMGCEFNIQCIQNLPDIMKFLNAALVSGTSRFSTEEKAAARKTIVDVMKKYDIKKKDIEISSKVATRPSSRVLNMIKEMI